MKIKQEYAILIVAFIIISVWAILISISLTDLYSTQNILIECIDTMQKLLLEITR